MKYNTDLPPRYYYPQSSVPVPYPPHALTSTGLTPPALYHRVTVSAWVTSCSPEPHQYLSTIYSSLALRLIDSYIGASSVARVQAT